MIEPEVPNALQAIDDIAQQLVAAETRVMNLRSQLEKAHARLAVILKSPTTAKRRKKVATTPTTTRKRGLPKGTVALDQTLSGTKTD